MNIEFERLNNKWYNDEGRIVRKFQYRVRNNEKRFLNKNFEKSKNQVKLE